MAISSSIKEYAVAPAQDVAVHRQVPCPSLVNCLHKQDIYRLDLAKRDMEDRREAPFRGPPQRVVHFWGHFQCMPLPIYEQCNS